LKAALRQLQKEIKDETPKAQKLMDDLAFAEEGEFQIDAVTFLARIHKLTRDCRD
jgi:hypothetical protein